MQAKGFLYVNVERATDLPAADWRVGRSSSDPYCIVRYGEHSSRTKTINEDLKPTWDHHCIFRLGSRFGNWLIPGARKLKPLEIEVYDEDDWSKDDLLGTATVDIATLEPKMRHEKVVPLDPPKNMRKAKGVVTLSFYWDPSPPESTYSYQVLGFLCFFITGAMCIISANCRWELADASQGSVKQPGVSAALVLASLTSFAAGIIHFVLAHVDIGSLADLLEYVELGPSECEEQEKEQSLVKARTRTKKLTQIEIVVERAIDLGFLSIPTLLIAWTLPLAAFGLIPLAASLQFLQQFVQNMELSILAYVRAGQILAAFALLVNFIGYRWLRCAECHRAHAKMNPLRDLRTPPPLSEMVSSSRRSRLFGRPSM